MKKIYIYKRFERFWHWTQALLILFLALTGFEIHSVYKIFGYKNAYFLHKNTGIIYVILLIIILTWLFFSGEWKQFIPKTKHMKEQINYYLNGIFKGQEHPVTKTINDKFNDLQRSTYFFIEFILLPFMVLTGLVYLNYNYINDTLNIHIPLQAVAYTHVAIALFLVAFVIGHIYLTTTGYKPLSAIKAMLTGWEEMSDEEATVALRKYLIYSIKNTENKIVTSRELIDSDTFNSVFEEVASTLGISNKELQERLLRSEIGYFKLDTNGIFVEVNEVWKKLYECSEINDPIGQNFLLNLEGQDKENLEYIFNEVMKKGEALSGYKVARYCKDGTKKYHSLSLSPIKQDGKITEIEGYIIDIKENN